MYAGERQRHHHVKNHLQTGNWLVSTLSIYLSVSTCVVWCGVDFVQSTSSLAEVALGRSGLRMEKGVSTSGLLGENLKLSKSPSTNTLVQRSWLPHEVMNSVANCLNDCVILFVVVSGPCLGVQDRRHTRGRHARGSGVAHR